VTGRAGNELGCSPHLSECPFGKRCQLGKQKEMRLGLAWEIFLFLASCAGRGMAELVCRERPVLSFRGRFLQAGDTGHRRSAAARSVQPHQPDPEEQMAPRFPACCAPLFLLARVFTAPLRKTVGAAGSEQQRRHLGHRPSLCMHPPRATALTHPDAVVFEGRMAGRVSRGALGRNLPLY